MALPVPVNPIEIPAGLAVTPLTEDPALKTKKRGNQFFHDPTKSSITEPVIYSDPDVCGDENYTDFRISGNFNQLSADCEIVPVVNLSISGRIATVATRAEAEAIFDNLRDKILEASGLV